ncbi:hypothetical protein DUNSADRAFT_18571 [Dunaliella salina]|uniref:GCVT N-terminal domain-containing protein n=1 Tax=Dunaliella salina TaxID=3046 RepID=A0ABQ7GYX1_DUNSA|nr:hypothetical protein DUNSADRAFT_18571 [Dunaliella salina]|eukprot:KAF5839808.1 hypothetical protein DUNSADRAFT_18571 [Dunaliella salina]
MQRASRHLLTATRALAQQAQVAGAGRGAGPSLEAGVQALWRHYATEPSELKKTVLHDLHVQLGGKMVDFAGWSMPIQYKDSIMDATVHCRTHASLFDVSHMCGFTLKGKDTIPFFESLVVGDIAGLENGTGCLSLYTNERGGVIDDTVVIKVSEDELYVVVNAGCRDKDLAHLNKHLSEWKAQGKQVAMTVHEDRSLLALQGPAAAEALQALTQADLSKQYFGGFNTFEAAGIPIWATRTGYTGEDGFEISVHNSKAEALTQKLMENPRVRLAGLRPWDSPRLEV